MVHFASFFMLSTSAISMFFIQIVLASLLNFLCIQVSKKAAEDVLWQSDFGLQRGKTKLSASEPIAVSLKWQCHSTVRWCDASNASSGSRASLRCGLAKSLCRIGKVETCGNTWCLPILSKEKRNLEVAPSSIWMVSLVIVLYTDSALTESLGFMCWQVASSGEGPVLRRSRNALPTHQP